MNRITKISSKISLSFLLLILIFTSLSFAQATVEKKYYGVILNPATQFITLNPGESFSGTVDISNDFEERDPSNSDFVGQSIITYFPSSLPFTQTGESGEPNFLFNESLPFSIDPSQWVSYGEGSYSLDFGETQTSNFTVTAPLDAEPGGYYAALIFSEQPVVEADDQVGINKAIAALLFITINGDITQDGELVEFKTTKPWYDFTPVDFITRFQNNGNIHDSIGGNIFIHKGDITHPVAILELNPDSHLVLPSSIREYHNRFEYGFITRNGEFKLNTKEFPKLPFGKYTATLKLKHYENNERITTEKNITFLVVLLVVVNTALLVEKPPNAPAPPEVASAWTSGEAQSSNAFASAGLTVKV